MKTKKTISKEKVINIIRDFFQSKMNYYTVVRKGEPYSFKEFKQLEEYIEKNVEE